jgi:hypothetical protein
MNGCFANPFALGTGLLRNHTLTSSPWGHGSYGIAADRFTVGAHSVGEAATPERFALGTGLLRNCGHPPPVGAHSVGEASMPGWFALGTGLLRIEEDRFTVGAHSVGEAPRPERFALGTGLLRNCRHPPPVGAHSVGEASMPGWFALGTGLLRNHNRATASPWGHGSYEHPLRPGDRAPTRGGGGGLRETGLSRLCQPG